jgi:hypothetical protein
MDNDTKEKSRVIDKEILEKRRKQLVIRRRIIAAVVLLLLIVAAVILLWKLGIFKKLKKSDPDKVLTAELTQVEYTPRGSYIMGAVEGCIIICDDNGVTGIDPEGKWKWNSTLSAYNPVFSGDGRLILVTDQGGKSIWAFDGSGFLWRHISENALICACAPSVSSSGSGSSYDVITICEQEDFESSVTLLKQENGRLSEVFTRKFGKYRMIAAGEPSDGSQIAASGIYYEGGTLSGCTVFMRASDGEAYSTILTDGAVYLQLRYLKDGTLFAANSDSLKLVRRIASVSGKGDTEKELWSRNGGRKMIVDTGVTSGNKCVAAFCDDNVSGGGMSELRYYDRSGGSSGTTEIKGRIRGMEVSGEFVAVFTEDSVFLVNAGGNIIGSYKFETEPVDIAFMGSKTLAVNTAGGIYIVDFA